MRTRSRSPRSLALARSESQAREIQYRRRNGRKQMFLKRSRAAGSRSRFLAAMTIGNRTRDRRKRDRDGVASSRRYQDSDLAGIASIKLFAYRTLSILTVKPRETIRRSQPKQSHLPRRTEMRRGNRTTLWMGMRGRSHQNRSPRNKMPRYVSNICESPQFESGDRRASLSSPY